MYKIKLLLNSLKIVINCINKFITIIGKSDLFAF